jgi:hypothetical protein
MANNFEDLPSELLPRDLMERAADPSTISDEALLSIILKTGAAGCDVRELSRRLLDAFGSLNKLISSDWRDIEERIKKHNKDYPDRPILGIGQPDGAMSMILDSTKTGVVFDWEDKAAIAKYIDECWEKHLEGCLRVEGSDISQFTRRNLTRRMAQLFEEISRRPSDARNDSCLSS